MKTLRAHTLAALLAATAAGPAGLAAQEELTDTEMAHVAVTASEIDIAYAHLALALSTNPEIRDFARTMIRDHTAVNGKVAELARDLGVQAEDNPLSRQLLEDATRIKDEMSRLRGAAFDRYYARNELSYHRTVNGVVADAFIPNAENDRVRAAFREALGIFRGHERHAEALSQRVEGAR